MEQANEIMVSVICNVFNQEKYIFETLQGFVSQVTDFKYEVLIHDDRSTDSSAEIIKKFESEYPDIIKPIYQTENQYSKKINIISVYQIPRAKGKYLAFCEGDDFWISPDKLQKQVDYLETHPDCTFCFTNAIVKNVQTGSERPHVPYVKRDVEFMRDDHTYDMGQLSRLSFIPTCSFILPKKNFSMFPDYYNERCFGGDRKLSLYSTSLGYAYFIDEPMCCYHYAVEGSALTRNKTKAEIAAIDLTFVNLNNRLNQFTENKFKEILDEDSLSKKKLIYCLAGKKCGLSDAEITELKRSLSLKDKLLRIIFACMPNSVFNFLRNLKRKK